MPLQPPVLDDLTWDDLVQVARSRIPAASGGEWTLHAPTDPGITLLELFAAQLEEMLYWVDQPCDTRQRAILRFLGVRPRAAQPAATVLAICRDGAAVLPYAKIGRGTIFRPQPVSNARVPAPLASRGSVSWPEFSTLFPILHFPVARDADDSGRSCLSKSGVVIRVDGKDCSRDLQMGRGVRLWTDPSQREVDVEFGILVDEPMSVRAVGTFGLFLDVETAPAIQPQWLRGALAPDGPAKVTWSYHTGAGRFQAFGARAVQDGTKGLRRPGVVRIQLGPTTAWEPVQLGSALFAYPLRLSIREASYPTPPRLRQIVPNAVLARHYRRIKVGDDDLKPFSEALGVWNLSQRPSPSLTLLDHGQSLDQRLACLFLRQGTNAPAKRWRPVDDVAFAGPDERVFHVDRELSRLTFGDGYNGRLPVHAVVTKLAYWIGGGRAGNLSAGREWQTSNDKWVGVNLTPAAGGEDPEPLSDAARRAAAEWHRPTRCVTAADCESLALHTPGTPIGRAHAVVGRDPQFPCANVDGAVTVYLVPDVPRPSRDDWSAHPETWAAPLPDAQILNAVRRQLERARLLTQQLFVQAPLYRDIAVAVSIYGIPADSDQVRRDVVLELYLAFQPLWGGRDGIGWPFGGPVYPTEIMERVQRILPAGMTVGQVTVSMHAAPASATACEPLAIGTHYLPALRSVQVRFLPQLPREGGLA